MDDLYPSPDTVHPVPLPDGSVHAGTVFLKPVIDHPRWDIGAYSYASAHHPPSDWAFHLAPYLYDFSPERLIIGKFCQIADGVQFITASANHRYDGFTSFPFAIFGGGPAAGRPSMPGPGPDTVIGHDVWLGQGVRVLPGARIGSGCIIGSGAVVSGEIPPYAIVAGNPAQVIRMRFSEDVIARLLELCWWDWPIERILQNEDALCTGDLRLLKAG
jgi:virginiamycin A acetyltransferase